MISPWIGIAGALGAFGLCFCLGNLLAKMPKVSEELARKSVHVLMGLVCLTFPWVFADAWPVLLLGIICMIGLLLVKLLPSLRTRVGGCLHGVDRHSWGELYFAGGIALLFWWSDGDPLMFCVPTLILTIADATSALIGLRYGKTSYATLSGRKSAEGSAMFFLTAFMSAHIPLLLYSGHGRGEVLLISLTLATMVMLVEAVATGGLDNLLIPLGGYYLLSEYLKMDVDVLLGRFALVSFLLVAVLMLRKRSTLNGGALLGGVLFAYGCFALGGWMCLITPLIVFLSHLGATRQVARILNESHTLSAVLSIAGTGMVWLVFRRDAPVAPFTLGMACHFAILTFNTFGVLRPEAPEIPLILRSTAKAVLLCYTPLILFAEGRSAMLLQAALAVPVILLATFLHSLLFPARPKVSGSAGRWITQCAIATGASCAALILMS